MISIGSVELSGNLLLAPLAGYSDIPFRLMCRRFGASLCVSEMISANGLLYRQPTTLSMTSCCREERPVSLQLFGSDPEIMGEAAALLQDAQPDLVDINMGCPVKKVTKKGAGAALMTDPHRAERIIRAVVSNSRCPVTVKLRSGPDHTTINAIQFARIAEDSGAAAITVHGRTWKQAFSGTADWNIISLVRQSVRIPVIGNGDVFSYQDAETKRRTYGCDGIMIGRGALGNPWIFSSTGRPQSRTAIIAGVRLHLSLVESHTISVHLGSLKNHLGRYFKGFPNAAAFRAKIYDAPNIGALRRMLDDVLTDWPDQMLGN